MARSYSVPSYSTLSMDRFKGVDLSVPEDQVKPYRAAWSQNMIPGEIGEIKKRPGVKYNKNITWPSTDNSSVSEMIGGKYMVIMSLQTYSYFDLYYKDGQRVISSFRKPVSIAYGNGWIVFASVAIGNDLEDTDSWKDVRKDWRIGGKTEGKDYEFTTAMVLLDVEGPVRVYTDLGRCCTMAEDGTWESERISKDDPFLTTPTIFKGCNPAGGGSPFQQINLLSPWVTESFCVKEDCTSVFYLNDKVSEILDESVRWSSETEEVETEEVETDEGETEEVETDESVRWSSEAELASKFKIEILAKIEIQDTGADEKQTIVRWIERPWCTNEKDLDGFRPSANRIYLAPEGNGIVSYEDDDGKKYNVFLSDKVIYRRADGVIIDADKEKATINYENGNIQLTDSAGCTWNMIPGWIPKTPVDGEDNVRITHWRAGFGEEFRKLCTAMCGTMFGVGGYKDRLFVGGSKYCEDRIYYSEMEDPFYIGDLNYIKLEEGCRVMALNGTSGVLAALTDQGIYMIQAQAQNNTDDIMYISDALFKVSGKVLAPAPLHYGDTEVLGGEIVYLSGKGIIAVAYKEHFDERFAEHRSALIDPQMMKDGPQQLISLGRFLMVRCKNGVWWLLDENQPNTEGDKPYSSHQYEGWRLTDMPADAAWAENGILRLVLKKSVCEWNYGSERYCDNYSNEKENEMAIKAYWDTPWIYGSNFHLDKNFIKMGVLLGEISVKDGDDIVPIDSAVRIEMRKNDEDEKDWKILWDYNGVLCTFNYGRIDYRLFTYSGEPGCPDLEGKIKIKKARRVKFRFSNDFINQGLILRRFCLNYVQEG